MAECRALQASTEIAWAPKAMHRLGLVLRMLGGALPSATASGRRTAKMISTNSVIFVVRPAHGYGYRQDVKHWPRGHVT